MKILLAVLGLITAFAVVPVDTRPLGSYPHPAVDHAASVARFAAVTEAERDATMDDARSTLLDHGVRTARVASGVSSKRSAKSMDGARSRSYWSTVSSVA